jgi:membrane glycosyltransferase
MIYAPPSYIWVVVLVIGVGLYLMNPAWLPYLLVAAMLFMHLRMHGHHGHSTHQHQPNRSEDSNAGSDQATHSHHS